MMSKLYRISFLPALFLAPLAVLGCGASSEKEHATGRSVEVTAEEYKFTPSQISVEPGETLEITLHNKGKMEHSIEFDVPGENPALEENAAPGGTGHLHFTAPTKLGSYTFFSPLGDDQKRGLKGTLVVTSRPTRR